MRPKFEVGEMVILQSVGSPECNGEYSVLGRAEGRYRTPMNELFEGYVYNLDDGSEVAWVETSLRKKHTPGELSFTDLMASLSSPKLITHTP